MKIGIKGKFVNHALYAAIQESGCKSTAEFCRKFNLNQQIVGKYLNLKSYPKSETSCKQLEEALGAPISHFFSKELIALIGGRRKPKVNFYLAGELKSEALQSCEEIKRLPYVTMDSLEQKELREKIAEVLETLNPREKQVLNFCFYEGKSNTEIAGALKVSPNRIYQIKSGALRKLHHPSRMEVIKTVL